MKNKLIIGYAYVVADILHFGHIQHLKNCKALCDKLIVGVLTDKATMEKKPKPIIGFKERLETVGSLACVDAVVAQETYSPDANVETIRPDILFESTSHVTPSTNPYGRVMGMPYFPIQSSTNIKMTIKKEWNGGEK
jgi:cytidyltransferase-like protein